MNRNEWILERLRRYGERVKARAEQGKKGNNDKDEDKGKEVKSSVIDTGEITEPRFLGGEIGKEAHEWIMKSYQDCPAVFSNVNLKDDVIQGSKPMYVVAVNEFFRKENMKVRTATQADLERILKGSKLPLKGNYEDTSLVWRTKGEPNSYHANNLFGQFKSRGVILNEGSAYVTPLCRLSLEKDRHSPQGVSFRLGDEVVYFEAPVLMSASGSKFNLTDIDFRTGLPTKTDAKGSRCLWTRDAGVSRLYLSTDLDVSSDSEDFVNSNSNGRVVVGGEAAALFGDGG